MPTTFRDEQGREWYRHKDGSITPMDRVYSALVEGTGGATEAAAEAERERKREAEAERRRYVEGMVARAAGGGPGAPPHGGTFEAQPPEEGTPAPGRDELAGTAFEMARRAQDEREAEGEFMGTPAQAEGEKEGLSLVDTNLRDPFEPGDGPAEPEPEPEPGPEPEPDTTTEAGAMEAARRAKESAIDDRQESREKWSRRKAGIRADTLSKLEENTRERKRIALDADKYAKTKLAELETHAEEIKSFKVDPDRLMNKKGFWGKLAMIIGATMGGFAAGYHGTKNFFLENLNNEIERDLAAQELALKAKKEGFAAKEALLARNLRRYGDLATAKAMSRRELQEMGVHMLAIASERANSEEGRANAKIAQAQVLQEFAQWKGEYKNRQFQKGAKIAELQLRKDKMKQDRELHEMGLKHREKMTRWQIGAANRRAAIAAKRQKEAAIIARADKIAEKRYKLARDRRGMTVAGNGLVWTVKGPDGKTRNENFIVANNPKDASELREFVSASNETHKKLQELNWLLKTYGAEWKPGAEHGTRATQLFNEILVAKMSAGKGVMSDKDMVFIMQTIGGSTNPTDWKQYAINGIPFLPKFGRTPKVLAKVFRDSADGVRREVNSRVKAHSAPIDMYGNSLGGSYKWTPPKWHPSMEERVKTKKTLEKEIETLGNVSITSNESADEILKTSLGLSKKVRNMSTGDGPATSVAIDRNNELSTALKRIRDRIPKGKEFRFERKRLNDEINLLRKDYSKLHGKYRAQSKKLKMRPTPAEAGFVGKPIGGLSARATRARKNIERLALILDAHDRGIRRLSRKGLKNVLKWYDRADATLQNTERGRRVNVAVARSDYKKYLPSSILGKDAYRISTGGGAAKKAGGAGK